MDTLYAYCTELREVVEGSIVFDEETGEVLFDQSNIEALEMSLASKAEGVLAVQRDYAMKAQMVDMEIKRLQGLSKAYKAHAERLNDYMLDCVKAAGRPIETPIGRLGTRKSKSISVIDEAAVPDEYIRVKVTREVDRRKATEAIKAGGYVPGVELVEDVLLAVK